MCSLKTLEEHNKDALRLRLNQYLTGVKCPKCDTELQYVNRNLAYLSNPPQYEVKCYECEFKGKIY